MTIVPNSPTVWSAIGNGRVQAGLGGALASAGLAGVTYAIVTGSADPDRNCHGPCPADLLIPIAAFVGIVVGTYLAMRLTRQPRAIDTAALAALIALISPSFLLFGAWRLSLALWLAAPLISRWLLTRPLRRPVPGLVEAGWGGGLVSASLGLLVYVLVYRVANDDPRGAAQDPDGWLELLGPAAAWLGLMLGTWRTLLWRRHGQSGRTALLAGVLAWVITFAGFVIGGPLLLPLWFAGPPLARWLVMRKHG